ncbi:holin [Lacticaseibacillus paracasei]|nr:MULTISPECIES: hypothetical protein [Lacticaseibacillus]AKU36038.1 holin [Lacticaseibacillus paracasei]MBB1168289.1 holin [Lacticaseibacillus paracasei]MBM6408849.1 holin [Lacticaseibacillus rhamnosus]MCT3354600.1 holin [Lacticaseibacillus paracasei]MCY9677171.1 holin [Lacticaseibacillus paracasei]
MRREVPSCPLLVFGGFILSLIALIITIVVAILDNQTD